MEAFIVPQIQSQATPAQTQHSGNNGTNESSFAPTLNQALAEQNDTSPHESADGSSHPENPNKPSAIQRTETSGGKEDFDLESTYALHSEIYPEKHSQITAGLGNIKNSITVGQSTTKHISANQNLLPDQQTINADFKTTNQSTTKHTSANQYLLSDHRTINADFKTDGQEQVSVFTTAQKPIFSLISNEIDQTNGAKSDKNPQISASVLAQLNSSPVLNPGKELTTTTIKIDEHFQSLGNNGTNTNGTVQNLTFSHATSAVPTSAANRQIFHLQENESIAFLQTKKNNNHVILQNSAPTLVENITGETKATASLSTESILTEITQRPSLSQTPSLRSDNISLRQDIAAQYIDKSLSRENIFAGQTLGQQQFNAEGENQNQSQFGNTAKTTDIDGENVATQTTGSQTTEKPLFSVNHSLKPGNQPLSPQFTENNILNQVIQKMRLSQNLHDSKLVMKLHPVELGELKIDVQLKDGTIQASIVAQNQQVQEILEKNMPRLREMMEQQGLNVNDIIVNLDGDLGSEYNLFEDHFAQEEDSTSSKKNKDSHSVFLLEDEVPETVSETSMNTDSMVNIKA